MSIFVIFVFFNRCNPEQIIGIFKGFFIRINIQISVFGIIFCGNVKIKQKFLTVIIVFLSCFSYPLRFQKHILGVQQEVFSNNRKNDINKTIFFIVSHLTLVPQSKLTLRNLKYSIQQIFH